ncbi:MAG: hypothetical protein OEW83_08215 [Acidimicrobiia bacterium]|nr:hypothetical protein [Acidimicrobiia bacterium]
MLLQEIGRLVNQKRTGAQLVDVAVGSAERSGENRRLQAEFRIVASAMASASSPNVVIGRMGPNVSSETPPSPV